METLATARALPGPSPQPAFETPAAVCYHLPAGGALPDGAEIVVQLPDATRFAYAARAAPGPGVEVAVDPLLRGNAFKPVHASATTLAAVLSLAASRRMDMGPESERVLLVLRGRGLVSLDNGDAHRVEPMTWAFVPAGEPARLWSQGPDDVLALVVQPQGQREEKRTLAGEIAKRRAARSDQ